MQVLPVAVCSPVATGHPCTSPSSLVSGSPIHSPEPEIACPKPLRSLPDLPDFPCGLPSSFASPGPTNLCTSDSGPLSSLSTSAGPSPNSEDGFERCEFHERADLEGGFQGQQMTPGCFSDRRELQHALCEQPWPASAMGDTTPPGSGAAVGDKLPSPQRKVFVGGIPQDMGSDELHALFREYGEVRRAWLQKPRSVTEPRAGPQLQHRGFGFVIFKQVGAVESLLSGALSRFLALPDGRRLEVKHAVGNDKMLEVSPSKPKRLLPGVDLTDARRHIGRVHEQRQASSQSKVPPCTAWIAGNDCDSHNERSRLVYGSEPSIMRQMHPPNMQAAAPPVILPSVSTTWGAECHTWLPSMPSAPPRIASATASAIGLSWNSAAGGHFAKFAASSLATSTPQSCAGVVPWSPGLEGPETVRAQALPKDVSRMGWKDPVLLLSQIMMSHTEKSSQKELEAQLLHAAPEYYED